jgi:hypothetical protein
VNIPDELRHTQVKDSKTGELVPTSILTIVVTDGSMPIVLEAWRDTATDLYEKLHEAQKGCQGQMLVLLRVENFGVKAPRERALVPMQRILATERTTITVAQGSGQDLGGPEKPAAAPRFFLASLKELTGNLGCVCNVRGVVSDVSDVYTARTGVDMRHFHLHDRQKNWVGCTLYGSSANIEGLKDAAEVSMFFAVVVKGMQRDNGRLWIYEEALLVIDRLDGAIPTQGTEVALREQAAAGAK